MAVLSVVALETHDIQLEGQIALQSNSIVICIKVSTRAEHAYPAAHDDVYQAVLGIKECGLKYGGNTNHLVFVGDEVLVANWLWLRH